MRWLELIAGGVWFWNPVFWIARRNLRANAELACDAWVVWALPEHRRAYAETLIDVSELISKSPVPIAALGMGARGVRIDFERRLAMILHESNSQRSTWKAVALAATLALLAMPGWTQQHVAPSARTQTSPHEAPTTPHPTLDAAKTEGTLKETSALETVLRSPVVIQFENQHISKIAEFISTYLSINIVVDQRVVKPAVNKYLPPKGTLWAIMAPGGRAYISDGTVHAIDLKAAQPSAILDEWTKQLKLTYRILPARIFISTAEQMEKDGALLATDAFRDIDRTQVETC